MAYNTSTTAHCQKNEHEKNMQRKVENNRHASKKEPRNSAAWLFFVRKKNQPAQRKCGRKTPKSHTALYRADTG